ncbi:hypothetical protein [Amycolatopsis magusensis]|uniref:hypothetical protein n=1 Tax=Amycolatopsis magusensis TaxID=882444 RepID=UPI0024A7CFC0|nr:hypothetical protein [Amycolatopsis magusensis]MDI5979747.1 hypothetical protein [Amycolatopsis magusensis]
MNTESCPRCGRPAEESTPASRHRTGEGTLSYRRCACGSWLVRLGEHVIGATGTH